MQINHNDNIHVKTHNDLDAVSSVILLKHVYKNQLVSVEYNSYNDIEKSIKSFLNNHEYTAGDILLITDISFPDELAQQLDKTEDLRVYLFDHHNTALKLNKYTWATVASDPHESATGVVYRALPKDTLSDYAELTAATTAWDTWDLESKHRLDGERINTLLGLMGKEEFIRAHLKNPTAWKSEPYVTITALLEAKRDRYINQVIRVQGMKAQVHLDGLCQHYIIIFATDYISELGNQLLERRGDDISYVCVINPVFNTVSLRSKGEIDVSKIAKYLGGGGHKNAAGFRVSFTTDINEVVDQILNRVNY